MNPDKIMQALQNGIHDIIVREDSNQDTAYVVPVSLKYLINDQGLNIEQHEYVEVFKYCHVTAGRLTETICTVWFEETGSGSIDQPIFIIQREERNATCTE